MSISIESSISGIDEHAGEAGVAPARGVERRLAHQAVHAGLGAQQAVGVVAFDLDGGALDAGRVARRLVLDVVLKPLRSAYFRYWRSSMLAQSQASVPPAPAWMSRKAFERVGRVVEHAAEFQRLDVLGQLGGFGFDGEQAGLVAFLLAHLEQLEVVRQLAREVLQRHDDAVELLLFLAQFLGLLGIVPDLRVFQRGVDRPQAFRFGIEVKDTPVRLAVRADRSASLLPIRLMRSASMVENPCEPRILTWRRTRRRRRGASAVIA